MDASEAMKRIRVKESIEAQCGSFMTAWCKMEKHQPGLHWKLG